MKKTSITALRFALWVGLTSSLAPVAYAQKTPKTDKTGAGEVHVKIIERSGDTVTELDRTYRASDMTDDKRDEVVKKLVDSLKTVRNGDNHRRQMTIIIDDNGNGSGSLTMKGRRNFDWDNTARLPRKDWPNNQAFKNMQPFRNNQDFRYQFRADIDSVADRLNRLNFNFPNDLSMRLARPFDAWSRDYNGKASTVRGLEAYPNNPDRTLLNVRFTAPAKGDVSIIVTNPKGKEVARKEVKDFSGEYVGQIDLGKNATGAYFITVTQNEDGAVKRIVVN